MGEAFNMNDPINPAHYAGRACADIGERLTANGYQILKYVWRLGKKDAPYVELGKAHWYALSEIELLHKLSGVFPDARSEAMAQDIIDKIGFLESRIAAQSPFTQTVARLLWQGYSTFEIQLIADQIAHERTRYASS